jgi:predicted  nucleic acid-binding Zn-ribbon protein
VALQELDTAADQLRHRRAHLSERAELTAVEREAAPLRSAVSEASWARDEIAARQTGLEADLAATEGRAASVNRRLYGGEVTASRELQALAVDAETLKARASALEDQVLELMEEREPIDARLADLDGRLAALDERRYTAAAALAAGEAVIDRDLGDLDRRRQDVASSVPDDLLATYDRLRARLGGVAVAHLVGNRCDGCHLTVPALELDHIRHLPEGEVATCEQCGRILVRG